MSTYRSANTRQSQTQSQNPMYSIQKRNQYAKQIPQLRPGQNRQGVQSQGIQSHGQHPGQAQGQFQRRRGTSIASTSVYDPEESQPIKLTIKQAITLITLRLGKLEVFANESKITGFPKGDFDETKNVDNVDKDFLLSIVSRLDNMEKTQHNLRVEVENFRKTLNEVHANQPTNDVLEEDPLIVDIFERLENLDNFIKRFQDPEELEPEQKDQDISEPINEEIVESSIKYPVYDPTIIEPYQLETPEINDSVSNIAQLDEILSQSQPQSLSQPQSQSQLLPPTDQIQTVETQTKTPRKRSGKKISI